MWVGEAVAGRVELVSGSMHLVPSEQMLGRVPPFSPLHLRVQLMPLCRWKDACPAAKGVI